MSSKKADVTIALFVILAMALSTYVFLDMAERLVSNEAFFEKVSTIKLKFMTDVASSAPYNLVYNYFENISSYDIVYDAGTVSISKYKYYPVQNTVVKKSFSKPVMLTFAKFAGNSDIDNSFLQRNMKLFSYDDINTKNEVRAIKLVMRGDSVGLQKVYDLIKSLLERDKIAINKDMPGELVIVLSDSLQDKSTVAAYFSLSKESKNQHKSIKLGTIFLNNIFLSSSLDSIKIRPVKLDSDLDRFDAGILLAFNDNFINDNYLTISKSLQASILRYFE